MKLFNKFRIKRNQNILSLVHKAHLFRRYIFLIIGVMISAISYNLFFFKNNIVYGGVSGISIITRNIIEPSMLILIANIFLLILSYFLLGKRNTIDSLVGSLLFPIFVKLFSDIYALTALICSGVFALKVFECAGKVAS